MARFEYDGEEYEEPIVVDGYVDLDLELDYDYVNHYFELDDNNDSDSGIFDRSKETVVGDPLPPAPPASEPVSYRLGNCFLSHSF